MNILNLLKHAFHYGTLSGLCSFGLFLILYFIVSNPLGNISYIGFWIPLVFIILAIKSYKMNLGEGYISYGQGFRTGTYTGFFSALLFSLLFYLFIKLYDATLVEGHKDYLLEQLEISKEMWNSTLYSLSIESINKTTSGSLAWNEFSSKFIGAFIASLILAAFFKTPIPKPGN